MVCRLSISPPTQMLCIGQVSGSATSPAAKLATPTAYVARPLLLASVPGSLATQSPRRVMLSAFLAKELDRAATGYLDTQATLQVSQLEYPDMWKAQTAQRVGSWRMLGQA